MDRDGWKRLRALKRLIHDGVHSGTSFVEKHHRHAAKQPFDALESIETIAGATKAVRSVHDGVLSLTYESIHAVNRATEVADEWVVSLLESADDSRRTEDDP